MSKTYHGMEEIRKLVKQLKELEKERDLLEINIEEIRKQINNYTQSLSGNQLWRLFSDESIPF
jgi:prefoldin subunit 5